MVSIAAEFCRIKLIFFFPNINYSGQVFPNFPCQLNSKVTLFIADVIWVYSNSSTLAHIDSNYTPIFYNINIKSAANLTQPKEDGLKGVLYYYQDTTNCNGPQAFDSSLPKELPKIALIEQRNDGRCNASMIDNILKAQSQGAVGVVMYGPQILQENSNEDQSLVIPSGTNITIVVYFVGVHLGEELLSKVMLYKNIAPSALGANLSVKPYIRLLLLPSTAGEINPWEITLLVVSMLLPCSNVPIIASGNALAHMEKEKKTAAFNRAGIDTYSSRNAAYGQALVPSIPT
ncbi:hypothetical protein [Parasitella parasitica]|uniref:PA domain-containing protein n=1 Tax=Parasitella parasitica TaxID=35722 RepID=A0A0B7NCP8_9FUNG|nr:hypothetical protein [Parasitella parasitica]